MVERQESGRIPFEARKAGLAALVNDKEWHKPDSAGVWGTNYHRAVELVLEAAAPLLAHPEPATRCTCDPGPEGQHRYWCATNGPHDCAQYRVTALDGEGESLGYAHCGICGRPAEPATGVTEQAVEAAYAAWLRSSEPGSGQMRAALEAASVYMGVRPVVDREAVERLVGAAWDDGNAMGLDGYIGPYRGSGDVDPEAERRREQLIERAVMDLLTGGGSGAES